MSYRLVPISVTFVHNSDDLRLRSSLRWLYWAIRVLVENRRFRSNGGRLIGMKDLRPSMKTRHCGRTSTTWAPARLPLPKDSTMAWIVGSVWPIRHWGCSILDWFQKFQFEVQSRGLQLLAGRPLKQRPDVYVKLANNLWSAKLQ